MTSTTAARPAGISSPSGSRRCSLSAASACSAAMTELSGAVIAEGSLVVESNVKKVQHPTGGIVGELLVATARRSSAGDILIRLDETRCTGESRHALTKSLWELAARQRAARGRARRSRRRSTFPPTYAKPPAAPDVERIVDGERKLFELRREARHGQKAQLRERIGTAQRRDRGPDASRPPQRPARSSSSRRNSAACAQLWEKNLIQMTRLTSLEREAARLKGERGQLDRGNRADPWQDFRDRAADHPARSGPAQRGRARSSPTSVPRPAELSRSKIAAVDQLQRIDIRAPQAGVVHQLSVHTNGGVIAAGEQIMLIVPRPTR